MADFNLVMPKLGESVQEATIIRWIVKPGDVVQEDDALLEIATDKVDSEIPSPVAGKVLKLLFTENALVPVGEVIAIINTEGKGEIVESASVSEPSIVQDAAQQSQQSQQSQQPQQLQQSQRPQPSSGRFYSPLVMSIAGKENIGEAELDVIPGTGTGGRVRKQDVLKYLETRKSQPSQLPQEQIKKTAAAKLNISIQPGDEIVEMDRMRKLIASHMVMSKQTSPHVTNFVEADVTNLVLWRGKIKDEFFTREKIKLTFMPAFVEATAKALREFPGVNASVDGDNIILRKNINIGFAVALKSGNLIVPVLKNADQKSLLGVAVELNRLAEASRGNSLSPDEIQEGTFTISNFGTFRNLTGTPIINQPQVAILATGNIEKKPAVIETPTGDVIAIRHKMILSLSYDHRVVDGALGGMFLRRIADLLEEFEINRLI
jgi:2-oxoglutarate dehydrogenase E2 component (dihydrolipoamide succinyltransferase)